MTTTTARPGFVAWTDNSDPIPAVFEADGAVTVDDAGIVLMIRGTLGPDGLGQYFTDSTVLETVRGLVELPTRPDGRRDILPIAGALIETDASGADISPRDYIAADGRHIRHRDG
jgi:hypothetical protein